MPYFQNELKYADITPIYIKNNRHEKGSHRSVSIIHRTKNEVFH